MFHTTNSTRRDCSYAGHTLYFSCDFKPTDKYSLVEIALIEFMLVLGSQLFEMMVIKLDPDCLKQAFCFLSCVMIKSDMFNIITSLVLSFVSD